MSLSENITLSELTRQERLAVWLRRKGINNLNVARSIGVAPISITRWFNAESIPTWRHRQLVDFGIPADLLPPAVDIAPGPKTAAQK